MTTSRSRGRSTSMSRRLCSRAPRTEMMSGSPAGTAFGTRGARGELGTAVATRDGVDFFPAAGLVARLVADFAGAFAEGVTVAFAGVFVARAGGAAAAAAGFLVAF